MKSASHYKTIADLAEIERLADANMKLPRQWHDGVDITHLDINAETEQGLIADGYRIEKGSITFLRWRG